MRLQQRIGCYSVTAKIGEGGMGEVYQARDTKLDRDVALKVLPEAFTSDPDRLARFEREAKVLASLNHPNIGSIYGLEEAEGVKALVLELIEGPTLADRIKQGPIPIDDALPIAKQIAEALEAAHEQGVIHRDLKPANIKVKDDGTVKVLDFGLAKAFQPDAGDASASMSPTISLTAAATQMGMVIGTAAYMAPEQAKGLPVDKRADIWAYGAVLFEMLTGKKLFDAGDVSEMLASVLVKDPDISRIGNDVPAHIRSVVRQCLVKDPKERLRDIGDVRLAMKGTCETAVATISEPAAAPTLQVWQRPVSVLGGIVIVALVTGLAVWAMTRPEPIPEPDLVRFTILPPDVAPLDVGGGLPELAISGDGSRIIYQSRTGGVTQITLRHFDQLLGAPVRGTEGAGGPFLSPDGESVGFTTGGSRTLFTVSTFGGPPQALTALRGGFRGASWGTDDQIVFGAEGVGLSRMSAAGGEAEVLTVLDTEHGELSHTWPFIVPGRDAVLFVASTGQPLTTGQLAVLDLATGDVTRLGLAGTSPRYVSTGHLVYATADGSVRAVAFDATTLELIGNPVPIVEGVIVKENGGADFSVSDNGRLVYALGDGGAQRTLVWVTPDGGEEPVAGLAPDEYRSVDISLDGSRLALDIGPRGSARDVWTYDLARQIPIPVTTEPGRDQSPLFTPDGQHVVFASDRDGNRLLYRQNADGTGTAELILADELSGDFIANAWSEDGDTLVAMRRRNGRNDLVLFSMEEQSVTDVLLEAEFDETRADVSPDGRWIAYESNRSGQDAVYVERFPEFGDRHPISRGGGQQPVWSPDGRKLFYLGAGANRLMAVPVTTGEEFSAGAPELLIEGPFFDEGGQAAYSAALDGRLVAIKRSTEFSAESNASPQIHVVLNWHQELKARVPIP